MLASQPIWTNVRNDSGVAGRAYFYIFTTYLVDLPFYVVGLLGGPPGDPTPDLNQWVSL